MPYSTTLYKEQVKNHINSRLHESAKILDVGAGAGTYSHLIREKFKNIDALEIFEPYVERFGLKNLYNKIFIGDINKELLYLIDNYDYIILGDVVEHMGIGDAQSLLSRIHNLNKMMLVGVPYKYEQDEWEGNVYEKHHQPDLTLEIFLKRYPYMYLLMGNENYGYFVNYKF